MGKARPRMDFKEDFGELNPREPSEDFIAQFDQTGRFIKFIEPGQRDSITPVDWFDSDCRIGGEVVGGMLISGIELMGQGCEFRFR